MGLNVDISDNGKEETWNSVAYSKHEQAKVARHNRKTLSL